MISFISESLRSQKNTPVYFIRAKVESLVFLLSKIRNPRGFEYTSALRLHHDLAIFLAVAGECKGVGILASSLVREAAFALSQDIQFETFVFAQS